MIHPQVQEGQKIQLMDSNPLRGPQDRLLILEPQQKYENSLLLEQTP